MLIATLTKYKLWLNDHIASTNEMGFFQRLAFWNKVDTESATTLLAKLVVEITELNDQLFLADSASLTIKHTNAESSEIKQSKKITAKANISPVSGSFEEKLAAQVASRSSDEINEVTKRSKMDFLHRKILEYQKIFRDLGELTNFACFLFLDDLYHLHRTDQVNVLDFFHRIAKNNNFWLKIGTIKNRSSWYIHGPQPIGLKIGDDADDINLDLTLEKFSSSRDFLLRILTSYASDVGAPDVSDFVAVTGIDRLVIASGGVTRDFLGIFRRSIDEARERLTLKPDHHRGEKISAEDVNLASGNYGDTKKEEFQRDTHEDREQLENVFEKVRLFCLSRNKANVFLLDQDVRDKEHELIQELIDLRLIHHVKSRVTVGTKPGKIYRALLLDISQYTGERRRRGIEMVEFWKSDNKDMLRRPRYIFDPTISVRALNEEIKKRNKGIEVSTSDIGDDADQMSLPFDLD